jgi:hypothetical protein
MTMEIIFTKEEIQKHIPYQMLCQTRYGRFWNTMRRKQMWDKAFTKAEMEEAEKLFRQCHTWYVGNGIPETVRMNLATCNLWNRLVEFCYEL